MVHDLVDTFPRAGGTKPRVGGTQDERPRQIFVIRHSPFVVGHKQADRS
jgi:hypothetical protein